MLLMTLGVTLNLQNQQNIYIFAAFHIFVMGHYWDFKFGTLVGRSWKGRGYVPWSHFNFWGPIHISGMAKARDFKFCTVVCQVMV